VINDRRFDGVLIVGGGATGIIIAEMLEDRGVSALLVEQQGLAGGQTAHCHGYLHRGYAYRRLSARERGELNEGADWWEGRAARSGSQDAISSPASVIAYPTREEARRAWRSWAAAGAVDGVRAMSAPGIAGVQAAFTVPERTIVPRSVLRLPGSSQEVLIGQAITVIADGPDISAIDVVASGHVTRISAVSYVLAAGLGIPVLVVGGATSFRERVSFMLVCETSAEIPHAFCLPSDEAQGLFAVSRARPGHRAFLLSNFASFLPSGDYGVAMAFWLRGMGRLLARFVPMIWDDDHAAWGIYAASKLESAGPRAWVPGGAVTTCGWRNGVVVAPGKLVLAPVYARRAVSLIEGMLGSLTVAKPGRRRVQPADAWASEDWERVGKVSRRQLIRDAEAMLL
jgi:glycine/D-amino acid oxidase-like deaminating enzyme